MMTAAFILIVGLTLGSFAGVVADRLPTRRSFVYGRSTCDGCHKPLSPFNLVPVCSFLLQRGRCPACRMSLSWRYPLYELTVAAACLAAWLISHSPALTLIMGLLAVVLVALSAIDLASMTIPDRLTGLVALTVLPLAWQGAVTWQDSLAGGFGAAAIAWLLHAITALCRRPALGFGDVKLLAACGLLTGLFGLPLLLMLAGGFGVLTGLIWRGFGRGARFPFGPAIAAGCYITLLIHLKGPVP